MYYLVVGSEMNKYLILMSIIFYSNLTIASSTIKTFLIDDKKTQFIEILEKRILTSSDCKNLKCMAIKKLEVASLKKARKDLYNGMNPGAHICVTQLSGKIIVGTNEMGMNTFCQFSDQSLIDVGTITFYANQNDKK